MTERAADLFTDLWEAEPKEPQWVIRDVLPVGLNFIGGPGKLAQKSTLALGLAAMVSGRPCGILPAWGREVPMPGRVLVFSAEAEAGVCRQMMETGLGVKGTADGSIMIADEPWDWRLDDSDGLSRMKAWLEELQPRLVILDPLVEFHSLEEKDAKDMVRLLRLPRQWAHGAEAAFLICHHTNKPQGPEAKVYDPLSMRGSGAILAKLDGALMVTPQPKGLKLVQATFKRARPWERLMRFGAYGDEAEEVLSEFDKAVLKISDSEVRDIATQLHCEEAEVRASVEKLERNILL